jgi:hypothetical protein
MPSKHAVMTVSGLASDPATALTNGAYGPALGARRARGYLCGAPSLKSCKFAVKPVCGDPTTDRRASGLCAHEVDLTVP